MRHKRYLLTSLFGIICSTLAATAEAQAIIGSAYSGPSSPATLYSISPSTGAGTSIGPIGFNRVSGLTYCGARLYAVGQTAVWPFQWMLLTINPSTGAATAVGPTGVVGDLGLEELACHADGTLFAMQINGLNSRNLHRINTSTGAATVVGPPGSALGGGNSQGNAIAMSPANVLYFANQNALFTLDQSTGAATLVAALNFSSFGAGVFRPNGLEFEPATGTLYASIASGFTPESLVNSLATINTTTGVVTKIGPSPRGLDALAVVRDRQFAVGAGAGGSPQMRTFGVPSGTNVMSALAYDASFLGGVSVAFGDTNGDGRPELITGPSAYGAPDVRIFDGRSGSLIRSFLAFDPPALSGIEVAAGDVNGDGFADVIAAGGVGGPSAVRVFDGRNGTLISAWFTISLSAVGGVHVAAGDVNGDGLSEVIVGAGPNSAPTVQVVNGLTGAVMSQFSAFAANFIGGVYVGAGDVTGDGRAEIITGAGAGGGPQVRVVDATGTAVTGPLGGFLAYTPGFAGGVHVAAGDLDGDGYADVIVGPGPGGGPHVRIFSGATGAEVFGLYAFDPSFSGGVFVAAAQPLARMSLDIPQAGTVGQTIRIAGWAIDETATSNSGIDAIHAWAFPVTGAAPTFVGAATSRVARADVSAILGGEFLYSGFDFTGTLAPGTYDLAVYVRNARSLIFNNYRVVRITVQ